MREWGFDAAGDEPDVAEEGRPKGPTRLSIVLAALGAFALYDVLPALLAWAFSAFESLDVLSPIVDATLPPRLGRLGLFLSAIAAVITTETVIRLGRPFGLALFVVTVVCIGGALFPFLALSNRLQLGFSADQFAVILAYAYLTLRVSLGILVGAILSWILLPRGVPAPPLSPLLPYTPRK